MKLFGVSYRTETGEINANLTNEQLRDQVQRLLIENDNLKGKLATWHDWSGGGGLLWDDYGPASKFNDGWVKAGSKFNTKFTWDLSK